MTIDHARELARLYFDEVCNRGNLAVVDQVVAPAFTLFVPPSLGEGPQLEGLDGFRQLAIGTRAAFSGLHFDVHDVTANDDTVDGLVDDDRDSRRRVAGHSRDRATRVAGRRRRVQGGRRPDRRRAHPRRLPGLAAAAGRDPLSR